MQSYLVADHLPVFSVTLSDDVEITFVPGAVIEAPEDNDYIQVLVQLGHLASVDE